MKKLFTLFLFLLIASPASATLPSSGPIGLNAVAAEAGVSATNFSLASATVRGLCGPASGAISLTNCYGKSSYTPMVVTIFDQDQEAVFVSTWDFTITPSITGGNTPISYHVDVLSSDSQVPSWPRILVNDSGSIPVVQLAPNNVNTVSSAVVRLTVTDDHGGHVSNTATLFYTDNSS